MNEILYIFILQGVSMDKINTQLLYAKTPVYIFDLGKIKTNYYTLKNKLSDYCVHYAIKANSEYMVLKALVEEKANFEVASINEYIRLQELGVSTQEIICSTPIIKSEDVELLYNCGCHYFVYDTISQLHILENKAPNSVKIVRISIAEIDEKEIGFGMSIEDLEKIKYLDGITFYMRDHNIIKTNKVFSLISNIIDSHIPRKCFYLNIGGGYSPELTDEYYFNLHKLTSLLQERFNQIKFNLYAEPGENVVKNAGYIISRVISIKDKDKITYVYIDASVASGLFSYKGIVSILGKQDENCPKRVYAFYDISCMHTRLCVNMLSTKIEVGDLVCLDNCGSYRSCFINAFHLFDPPQFLDMKEISYES